MTILTIFFLIFDYLMLYQSDSYDYKLSSYIILTMLLTLQMSGKTVLKNSSWHFYLFSEFLQSCQKIYFFRNFVLYESVFEIIFTLIFQIYYGTSYAQTSVWLKVVNTIVHILMYSYSCERKKKKINTPKG